MTWSGDMTIIRFLNSMPCSELKQHCTLPTSELLAASASIVSHILFQTVVTISLIIASDRGPWESPVKVSIVLASWSMDLGAAGLQQTDILMHDGDELLQGT